MIDMENLVRQVMTEQTEALDLGPDAATKALRAAARRRRGHKRLALIAGAGAAFVVAGTGIAAATGVIPWWASKAAVDSSPFATAPEPAAVAGSTVRLTVPGPESTTFELVTNTVTMGATQVNCTAVAVKDARGRSQHLTNGCGTPGMATPRAASFDWQAPSGATYAIVTGPDPTSNAVKVALKDSDGVASATEPVSGGYYLVYVPAEGLSPTGSLVFYDASGQVVDQLALDLAPLVPCAESGNVAPCG
jgi:hypothetical protein